VVLVADSDSFGSLSSIRADSLLAVRGKDGMTLPTVKQTLTLSSTSFSETVGRDLSPGFTSLT
jgi:hypothetical protein